MQVFLAGVVGLLGVCLVVAGVGSHGSALFTALTGIGVDAPGGPTLGADGKYHYVKRRGTAGGGQGAGGTGGITGSKDAAQVAWVPA